MILSGVLNGLKLREMHRYKEIVLGKTLVVSQTVGILLILLLLIGQATRYCNSEGVWADPDVVQCKNIEFVSILEQVSIQTIHTV